MSHSTTFVCCIEAGALEDQVIRLLDSLRRWGGAFADAPVMVCRVRPGPPLKNSTHSALKKFGADYVKAKGNYRYSWLGTLNKARALELADQLASTPFMTWLDSDILILKEPSGLIPSSDVDFLACARDKEIGSEGPEDPHDTLFTLAGEELDVPVDKLPWIQVAQCGRTIRAYWNGGVFTVRRGKGFGALYLKNCQKLIKAGIGKPRPMAFYFTDQIVLPFTLVALGMAFDQLPLSYNAPYDVHTDNLMEKSQLDQVHILHYHKAMAPQYWPDLLLYLKTIPSVYDWLRDLGPIQNTLSTWWLRILAEVFKWSRLIPKHLCELSSSKLS